MRSPGKSMSLLTLVGKGTHKLLTGATDYCSQKGSLTIVHKGRSHKYSRKGG
jgi:hypothetical protein